MVVSKPGNCGGPSAAGKPVVVVLRQGGRRYPGNSGGPGNGGGKSNCAAAFLPATPEAQVTVVVNPTARRRSYRQLRRPRYLTR